MSQTAIHADLEAEFAAVAASSGCELVHLEFRGNTLRVYLDRPEGVSVDDCALVSRELSALLDVHDFGDRRYLLEVSSPGLDRPLFRPEDYVRFRGHLIRVTFRNGPARTKKTIVGRLEEAKISPADAAQISVVEATSAESFTIALRDVDVARLEIEL